MKLILKASHGFSTPCKSKGSQGQTRDDSYTKVVLQQMLYSLPRRQALYVLSFLLPHFQFSSLYGWNCPATIDC